ncbi:hypothetical protein [Sandaracinobacteroides hominis]|uniref:hypothetical protein n=1 Tax=Sandaracinobacteroides hominis TaxID=2780086 RepID=UPI0018F3BA78|nr:hypothetical protein [Sandaracinobacteroides hominis]
MEWSPVGEKQRTENSVFREVKIDGGNGGSSADAIAHMPYANTARLYLHLKEPLLGEGRAAPFLPDRWSDRHVLGDPQL